VSLPFLDARVLPMGDAVDALEAALRDGLDVEADPPRSAAGPLLLMPSLAGGLGVKLVTVGDAEPRVQGLYVLFDDETLAPVALVDGISMTEVRTAAVSALAVRHLAERRERLVVFGTGPQARAHIAALGASHVRVVSRDASRAAAFADEVGASPAGPEAVADADVIVCATTAREPLFDGDAVPDHATVVAIGSHEPDAREVDERLVSRSTVIVESRPSALREAGDIVLAGLGAGDLHDIGELVRGEVSPAAGRPRLFKSTGMAWEDLVIAQAVAHFSSPT
jgi:ornithine cyclodeaminase/alanine dehydrogenase-like protein (mu-crystallin family)